VPVGGAGYGRAVPEAIYPPKPKPGDKVAVLSPASGLPELFPHVFDQGLLRLREVFDLEPVEFPTTRRIGTDPRDRARDLHAAFADPEITAVLASIGGDDQITVLRHLDADLMRENRKPFFGYSDNTNLLNFLWRAGVVSYHGGSVMVHLGRGGRLHPAHEASLRSALFGSGWHELIPPDEWSDEPGNWSEPGWLDREPPMWPSTGWTWVNDDRVIEGPSWGGNLEILSWLLMADRDIAAVDAYSGHVLFVETSEEMPSATEVYRILRNMGERGLLARFPAVLVGRAKAWEHNNPQNQEQKREYAAAQRDAFERALAEYNPTATIVFDLDIGHTDPQLIVPYGGTIRVDGPARRIFVRY
jgi:muramoyltetrapeptide carboxypeptidase LdcA involved in peptidoglycan recycling